jgi:hypothetical protein
LAQEREPVPREAELVEPLCQWFREQFRGEPLLLIHEEASGHGGRRPDLLVVFCEKYSTSIDDATMISVEIENSTKGAIHDRKNGLLQLRKYPGHLKFLAIPDTIASRRTAREIERRCADWGVGLLIVESGTRDVSCVSSPKPLDENRTLRVYPTTMKRRISLRNSTHSFRGESRMEQSSSSSETDSRGCWS